VSDLRSSRLAAEAQRAKRARASSSAFDSRLFLGMKERIGLKQITEINTYIKGSKLIRE